MISTTSPGVHGCPQRAHRAQIAIHLVLRVSETRRGEGRPASAWCRRRQTKPPNLRHPINPCKGTDGWTFSQPPMISTSEGPVFVPNVILPASGLNPPFISTKALLRGTLPVSLFNEPLVGCFLAGSQLIMMPLEVSDPSSFDDMRDPQWSLHISRGGFGRETQR